MKNVAIVTGATSGVGREFVRQLDEMLYGSIDEIWAVARSAEGLSQLSEMARMPVRAFALDLTDPSAPRQLEMTLELERAAQGVNVVWLVNSAGSGWFGGYQDMDSSAVRHMVELNCLALADITSAALPYMSPGSRIVNMASIAAFLPLPGMALYAATKRFVLDLTHGLNEDLRGTGINACAVCPKAMRTGFWDGAGSDEAKGMGFFFGTEDVADVVRKAIHAVQMGRGSVVTSPDMKLACAAFKVMPYGMLCGLTKAALAAHRSLAY